MKNNKLKSRMSANAFIGQSKPPKDRELAAALGPAKAPWDRFLTELEQDYGVNVHEWKCHSPKWGWSLRAKHKARTIVWLSPHIGCFTVLFILGAKAMCAARQCKLPMRIVKAMDEAPKYPEGTGVRLKVKSAKDIGALKKLAAIKLAN
jgi:hypothetical protein